MVEIQIFRCKQFCQKNKLNRLINILIGLQIIKNHNLDNLQKDYCRKLYHKNKIQCNNLLCKLMCLSWNTGDGATLSMCAEHIVVATRIVHVKCDVGEEYDDGEGRGYGDGDGQQLPWESNA